MCRKSAYRERGVHNRMERSVRRTVYGAVVNAVFLQVRRFEMYLALYRKWRPKTFADVCGQDFITEILKREVEKNTVSHAYLFCGLRGTGKTTCAKILAKAVNCLSPVNGEPCGECENCLAADKGTMLDIVEIDAASNNGVDNIRSVIEEVSFLPSQGKRKVYIIDEVHMLSGGAFNALLKTLEEPPEHVLFILCTTETHKIPATILSRCQRFDFGRINSKDIIARLDYIAKEEKIELDEKAAALIARLSEGAMRDALSLLELCTGNGEKITYELASRLLGVPDREKFHKLCGFAVSKDTSSALVLVNEMLGTGKASTICSELIGFFRDLMVVSSMDSPESLMTELPDEIEKCRKTASAFTRSRLIYSMSVLEKCLLTLPQANVNAKTALEMAVIKLCNIEKTMDVEALFARVEALEKGALQIPAQEQPILNKEPLQNKEAPAVAEEKPKDEVPKEEEESSAKALDDWSEFVDEVSREDKVAGSFVRGSIGYVKGDKLQIVCSDSMSASILNKAEKLKVLKYVASGVIGRPMNVEVIMKEIKNEASGLLD